MNTLENKIGRFRKITQMIEELKDAMAPLKQEAVLLHDELLAEFSKKPSLYNLFRRPTAAAGLIGRELFTANFGQYLDRIDGGKDNDQKWLNALSVDDEGGQYVKTQWALDKEKIQNRLRNNEIDDVTLRRIGLHLATSGKIKVLRIKPDPDIKALTAAAEAMAKEDA